MEGFEDSIYDNPYDNLDSKKPEDVVTFSKEVTIMATSDGKVRSGRNTAKFGKEHDYFCQFFLEKKHAAYIAYEPLFVKNKAKR